MNKCPILNANSLPLGLIGINHKSASLSLREKLSAACERLFGARHSTSLILLSTCNRTEVYFASNELLETHHALLQELRGEVEEEFEHALYSYFGLDTFVHLGRVTSGLDSAVIGETEIQGQVKHSYEKHKEAATKELHFAFQKSLKIGKEVRTHFLLEKGMPSLEGAILKFGSMMLGPLQEQSLLFVGASEINRKVLRHLKMKGVADIAVCNRTLSTAQQWAREEQVRAIHWEQLGEWKQMDWVIVGTKAPDYLLTKAAQGKKRLLVDLSLPRNIDPALGQIPNTLLLNIDQINHAVDSSTSHAREAIQTAEWRIRECVNRQVALFIRREQRRALLAV